MRITVFGASGKVGQLVVQRLLEDGHDVVAFVHKSSPFPDTENLTIMRSDVHKLGDVKPAVKGSQAVISTLGSWGTKQKDIVSSGTQNMVSAMSEYGVKRIITLTGSDATTRDERLSLAGRIVHAAIKLSPARKVLADGEKHIRLLEDSSLDWTALRSPVMNAHGDPHKYELASAKLKPWATIHRQSVADAMVRLVAETKFYRQAPFIKRRQQ